MADTFRELEKGYEAKFKLDEELRFKVRSRCNKLFGLWAAARLGLAAPAADGYARKLVRMAIESADPKRVIDTVESDFGSAGVRIAPGEVPAAFNRCYAQAGEQIAGDYPMPLDTDHVQVGG
jgi:hypothetical protein